MTLRGATGELRWVYMTAAVFGPWVKFAEIPADKFAAQAPALAKEIAESKTITPAIAKAFAAYGLSGFL
mgnify:CR=1 FL=1